jgi:COP9 signalosome complex subunit 4
MLEPKYKVDIYVRIAQLYLEEEESVEAERYLNRASELIHLVNDKSLQLKYRCVFSLFLISGSNVFDIHIYNKLILQY